MFVIGQKLRCKVALHGRQRPNPKHTIEPGSDRASQGHFFTVAAVSSPEACSTVGALTARVTPLALW
jgi:hypothetical protein